MSASSQPTIVPLLLPRARKLRSSCDSCGLAKVKCDRDQLKCGRCVALGLTCIYGLSRQFGKPPRKRPRADVEVTASGSYKKRTIQNTGDYNNHRTVSFWQPQIANETTQFKGSDTTTGILPLTSAVDTVLDIDEQTQLDQTLFSPFSFDGWPQFGNLWPGLENPAVPECSTPEGRSFSSASEHISTTRMKSNNSESHSCPRESYEILRDLICPSPYLHAPESSSNTVSTQLDQVLLFVNSAIDRLSQLLKCSCARSGHRVMVHASIISRILIWYQQAAGWSSSSSSALEPRSLTPCDMSSAAPTSKAVTVSNTAEPPTLAQSTGFIVADVPVSIGAFSVEDQNIQAATRNQLVSSELKKTAKLIDLFACQASDESSASDMAGLCSCLGAWLRSEQSRTIKTLRSRLIALNKALDS